MYKNKIFGFTQDSGASPRKQRVKKVALGIVGTAVVAGIGAISQAQAQAQDRWLEIQRLTGVVSIRRSEARPAEVGDRLAQPGHSLTTSQASSTNLALDDGIGSISVAQNTHIRVQRLATLSDGAKVSVLEVTRGQARIQARPFTHPNTVLELRTPSGVAAVRGTEFGLIVAEDGKTSVGTLEGQVDVSAESVTVQVEEGEASIIRPGEPPSSPTLLDRELDIEWFTQEVRGGVLRVSGRIAPTNAITVEGQEIEISPRGNFEWQIGSIRRDRSVAFVVQNPLGETRLHRIRLWQLPNLDGGGNRRSD